MLSAYSSCSPSRLSSPAYLSLVFFNDPATTEIYTLSLHDALPISRLQGAVRRDAGGVSRRAGSPAATGRSLHAIAAARRGASLRDRKSTRLNSSHVKISYAVFCLKKKKKQKTTDSTLLAGRRYRIE